MSTEEQQVSSSSSSSSQAKTAIQSLAAVIPSAASLSSSPSPSSALLTDPSLSAAISDHLRQPDSGAGDNQLCRWLYDTFHTSSPDLQLVVLRHLPTIAGVYLSRIPHRKPLAGFEAVLLAIYAHEATSRSGHATTVNLPDLSHPSVYHEAKNSYKHNINNSTELRLAIVSPGLEPQGTIRSTKRARIIGVALELYHSRVRDMPVQSKIDFCEFCAVWAGQDGGYYRDFPNLDRTEGDFGTGEEGKEGRVLLPWEMLQPILRILGHCLMGVNRKGDEKNAELYEAACRASRSLYARALHDINPKAILAMGSLLKLVKFSSIGVDHTELPVTNVINL